MNAVEKKAIETGVLFGLSTLMVGYLSGLSRRVTMIAGLTISAATGIALHSSRRQPDPAARPDDAAAAAEAAAAASEPTECERTIGTTKVVAKPGDIVKQTDAGAIVNAANASMGDGGGVSGAIYAEDRKHDGPMKAAVEELGGRKLEPGEAASTVGWWENGHVIHALGPVYNRSKHDECCAQLKAAYEATLAEAEKLGVKTLACVFISGDLFGFPADHSGRIAWETTRDYIQEHPDAFTEVRFVCMVNLAPLKSFVKHASSENSS